MLIEYFLSLVTVCMRNYSFVFFYLLVVVNGLVEGVECSLLVLRMIKPFVSVSI